MNKRSPIVRICALGTVIFLIILYIGTLIAVIADTEYSDKLLKASLLLTIVMPTLIYGLNVVMNVLSGKYDLPSGKDDLPSGKDDLPSEKDELPSGKDTKGKK